jgi:pimeloyl-ACP methyl ester carboxylesterase
LRTRSWLADLALEPLAQADFPKLVIVGAWDPVPPGYRPGMARAMLAVSETVADRIGATLMRIPGAAHEPQRETPAAFNTALADFWAAA